MIVYIDYVCPFCLLAENTINSVAAEHGVEVEWRPFELRPTPAPTLRPEDDYLPRIWGSVVYPMAAELGVEMTLPSVSPQPYTHTAFEGYQYASEHDLGAAYNERVLRAFFQEDRDIGQIDVLTELAVDVGLDGEEFAEALVSGRYADVHRRALTHAQVEARITAVPTVLVGSHRLEGMPNRERLTAAVADSFDRVA